MHILKKKIDSSISQFITNKRFQFKIIAVTRRQLQICICLLVNIVGSMKIWNTSTGQFFEIAALVHSEWLGLQLWCRGGAQWLQPACNLCRASTWALRCASFVRKHPFSGILLLLSFLMHTFAKIYSLISCVCLNQSEIHACKIVWLL